MEDLQFPQQIIGAQIKRKCVTVRDVRVLRPFKPSQDAMILRPSHLLERLIRLVQGSRVRRVYVLTLVALTTVTWTCLVAMLFTMGVLVPLEMSRDCESRENGSTLCPPRDGALRLLPIGGATNLQLISPNVQDKVILRWTKYYGKEWKVPAGNQIFEDLQCPQRHCFITDNKSAVKESDALLVHMRDIVDPSELPRYRRPDQRWVFYLLESPYHTKVNLTKFNGLFNWTSTYSYDSDIPSPYGSFVQNGFLKGVAAAVNFQSGYSDRAFATKTRLAAWFVTNCKSRNRREEYVSQMQSHMMVDVYGICGKLKCHDRTLCHDMLKRKYKFYLAFENSNCRQYITEKFWHNALENDIVPVVMGAPKEDYERVAPPHSFIHIDDFPSSRELTRYLRMLHKDTRLYNEYFRWKRSGQARTHINEHPTSSQFWCHLCSALHDTSLPPKVHQRIDKWWSVPNQCF